MRAKFNEIVFEWKTLQTELIQMQNLMNTIGNGRLYINWIKVQISQYVKVGEMLWVS